jgi:DNA polymerase III subunit gamma/tau
MSNTLYRKYRSANFSEVIGQDHIISVLQNSIASGKFAHAYLFTGPRGVGKTSVARILAHAINGLDYVDGALQLDIIEIDAASNRRIDEIRDLKDKINISPTSSKYKVYIIDEVHMLTKEAFNALLKTLEEPPAHVIFILATTEIHKLPDTIVSRTQRYNFKPISNSSIVEHLQQIAIKEEIDITPTALNLIAELGEGSFRDCISLLDQCRGLVGRIDTDTIETMLGLPSVAIIKSLLVCLYTSNVPELLNQITSLRQNSTNPGVTIAKLCDQLRQDLYAQSVSLTLARATIASLLDAETAYDKYAALEVAILLNMTDSAEPMVIPQKTVPIKPTPAKASLETVETKLVEVAEKKPTPSPINTSQVTEPTITNSEPMITAHQTSLDQATWKDLLSKVKSTHNSLYTILRLTRPELAGDKLELHCKFKLHAKQLEVPKNKEIVLEHLANLGIGISRIETIIEEATAPILNTAPAILPTPTVGLTTQANPSAVSSEIMDIFGAGEILTQ